jgi:hypothetical protein
MTIGVLEEDARVRVLGAAVVLQGKKIWESEGFVHGRNISNVQRGGHSRRGELMSDRPIWGMSQRRACRSGHLSFDR